MALSSFRFGSGDPTTRLGPGTFWRATFTPDGPGTLFLDWRGGPTRAQAWGPGADWLLARVPALTGELDPGHRFVDAHPVVMRAQRNHPDVRFGASGTLYHELLPNILGQRITAREALQQWRLLVMRLGEPAPGPNPTLRLPPAPESLVDRPSWWFHPLGIEVTRAETLRQVARHASRLHDWATLPSPGEQLRLLPGVGQWTVGCVLATAMGDPDAVAVGDYHLKNVVVHAFTGRPRGTDEEMMDLLEPYVGQRGRVVKLLLLDGHRAPKFGPRQRVLPLKRW
jgi:3-methyladenine DNA glycosylase/8-oxoguanine DNA glycosylase